VRNISKGCKREKSATLDIEVCLVNASKHLSFEICADTLRFGYPNQVGSDTMTASCSYDIDLGKYQIKMTLIWANIRSIEPSQHEINKSILITLSPVHFE
jgi:hypothetical protein